MQASFTDLVGTTVVPTNFLDSKELTDLTPALDTATAAHDMAEQAGEAKSSAGASYCFTNCNWDTTPSNLDLAAEAGRAAATGYSSTPTHNTCC